MGDAEAEQTPVFGIRDVHKPLVASGVPQAKRGDHWSENSFLWGVQNISFKSVGS